MDPELVRLLADEYMHLQQTIEAFDAKALHIKEWGTGISVAVVAFALKQRSRWIACLAGINALCFWMIEATWKLFQWAYMGRIWTIETYFRNLDMAEELAPLQITRYWLSQWRGGDLLDELSWKRDKLWVFVEKLCDVNVALPYVMIIALVGVLFCFWERLDLSRSSDV